MHPLLVKVGLANLERELEAADSLSKTSGSHVEACLCRVGVGHTEPISERPIPSVQSRQRAPKTPVGAKERLRIQSAYHTHGIVFPPHIRRVDAMVTVPGQEVSVLMSGQRTGQL